MNKKRSIRNKTLILSAEEYIKYSPNLLTLTREVDAKDIINKTINQDLLSAIDYLPKHFADLIIIDPPYNLTKNYNETVKFKQANDDEYLKYVSIWLPKIIELLKSNGSIYVCCDWRSSAIIYQVLSKLVNIKNRITWQREKGRGAKSNWKNSMEDIWFGVVDNDKYYFDVESVKQKRKVIAPYKVEGKPKDWVETENGNFRLTHPSNFWDDISIPYWSMPENTEHPTQKPEKLIAKLILASSPKNGIVFDPFLGSGTTSVVAKKLNRLYCGVEIDKDYSLWCEKRLEIAENQKDIQGYCNGIFWERNTLSEQIKIKKKDNDNIIQGGLF